MSEALVIGVGNPWRGDDGAGPAVARLLSGTPGIQVAECGGEATELMQCWAGFDRVFLVDAVVKGKAPGEILRLTIDQPLPSTSRHSSHGLGLAEAVELARALGELPPELVIYGIEPQSLDDGASLSPVVAAVVETVARAICEELNICRSGAEG
ncbi:MAG: hydrogenase maturation protease [Thioalkalivibrio sp.]